MKNNIIVTVKQQAKKGAKERKDYGYAAKNVMSPIFCCSSEEQLFAIESQKSMGNERRLKIKLK